MSDVGTPTLIRRVHATDLPQTWCAGEFHPAPVRLIGLGHPSSPHGWEVHHCETCGEDLYIGYDIDPKILPDWQAVKDGTWRTA